MSAVAGPARDDAAGSGFPEENSALDSVSGLLGQDDSDARQRQEQQQPSRGREWVFGQASSHPFAEPFVVPNLFEPFGIRRRNDIVDAPQGRQRQVGVTAAIEAILGAPYRGPRPDSLHSLFRNDERRVVRKTPSSSGSPPRFSVVGSDDPSQAAVRLFPSGSPFPRPAAPRPDLTDPTERPRRNVGQRGTTDHFNTNGERLYSGEEGRHDSQEWTVSLPDKEFGDIIVHYEYDVEDPAEQTRGRVVTLPEDEVNSLLTPFNGPPARPPNPEAKPYPIPGPRKPPPRPRPHPVRPSLPRHQFRQRPRHPNLIPGFRPGPSPPAHILPSSSTIRAPRHVLQENLRLPRATRQEDIHLVRRTLLLDDPAGKVLASTD